MPARRRLRTGRCISWGNETFSSGRRGPCAGVESKYRGAMTRQCDSGETSPFRAARRCGLYSRGSPPPPSRRARLQSRLRHRDYSRARTVSQLESLDGSTSVTYTARCDVAAGRTHEAACPPVTGLRGSVANCFHQAPESREPAVCSGSRQIAVECPPRTCLGSKPCEHALASFEE